MAVKTSYVIFKGQKYVATYDNSSKTYSVEITAPSESSWGQPDHVFLAEVHAEDSAGNKTVINSSDETYGEQLKIRVLEKTKPTAKITTPTEGSVLGTATQNISMELQDMGGSGLNMSSVVFKVNGIKINSGLTWKDEAGKKTCTYQATGLSDGANKVELQVSDNDGNISANTVVNFIISTAAPTLDVTSPENNLITNQNKVTVSGKAEAGSQNVTLAEVTVNGEKAVVGEGGAFSKEVSLVEGSNTITVIAKDNIGKTTTVIRKVTLDTKAPVITDIVAEATTVDAGGRIRITFKVTDPA